MPATDHLHIASLLERNGQVFEALLKNTSKEIYLWKPAPEKWGLLEIVCHLYDEEREDFRARTNHILTTPERPMPQINPQEWVGSRKYMEQGFDAKLSAFLEERKESIAWIRSLPDPKWDNAYQHPKVGPIKASLILTNWVAHDYLHIRQITKVKYEHLKTSTGVNLEYAGTLNG